jgi:hypothetical protein
MADFRTHPDPSLSPHRFFDEMQAHMVRESQEAVIRHPSLGGGILAEPHA